MKPCCLIPILVAKSVWVLRFEPSAAILHAGVAAKPRSPPAKLINCAAVCEPTTAAMLGAKIDMRDSTYAVIVRFALSNESVISAARIAVYSSLSVRGLPELVVASTVTVMYVGPSNTARSLFSLSGSSDLISRLFPMMATHLA